MRPETALRPNLVSLRKLILFRRDKLKGRTIWKNNNRSKIATAFVLAILFLTLILIPVSLSQTRKVEITPSRVSFGIDQSEVEVQLTIKPASQVNWKFRDSQGKKFNKLDKDFFTATIEGNVAKFTRKNQKYGNTTVRIGAISESDGSGIASKEIQVAVWGIKTSQNYVSFVQERKIDIKLSTNLNPQPSETIQWIFSETGNALLDNTNLFFSAEIIGNTATFQKLQGYGKKEITIVATKTDQQGNTVRLAEKKIPVLAYNIPIQNNYVVFYHNKGEKITLSLEGETDSKKIGWCFLDQQGQRLPRIEEEFFSAKVVESTEGNAVEFNGVKGKFGESIITIAAAQVIDEAQPLQNVAEKKIKVIVPSEKTAISKIAKLFHFLKTQREPFSLIIRGGDIMLILIVLFVLGIVLSLVRIIYLLLWSIGDKEGELEDRFGRTNLSRYANDIIKSAKDLENDNNPIARVFEAGIKTKDRYSSHTPPISKDNLEFIIREDMEAEIERQEERLSKWTRAIEICNVLAPMVGFFGTIVGLIAAFMDWTNSAMAHDQIEVQDLAGGMYQAMITTAGGLIVAIVVSALLGIIFYRIRKFTRLMSDNKDEISKALAGGGGGSTPQGGNNLPGSGGGHVGATGGNISATASGGSASPQGGNNPSNAIRNNVSNRTKTRNDHKIKTPGIFSLTDIVLNLFIFFFITFNLIAAFKTDRESNIKDVSIPRVTATSDIPIPIKPLRVIIKRKGSISLMSI